MADLSGMMNRFARLRSRGPAARTAALQEATSDVMDRLLGPGGVARDTQRMARGFALAANAAGLRRMTVPAVRRSRNADEHLAVLRRQAQAAARAVERWTRWERRYQLEGRTRQPYYRTKIAPALNPDRRGSPAWVLRRTLEEAAKYAGALDRGFAPLLVHNRGRAVAFTARDRIYGGTGRTLQLPDVTLIEIRNMEPHAIIQERRRRTVRTLLMAARRGGARLQRAKRIYLRELRAAA